MDYRYLGQSALKVSPICLGAMMFGGNTDAQTAKRIIDKAASQGINFLDTAGVYNDGKSEEVIGCSVKNSRDNWIIATKFGYGSGTNQQGQSRKWILQTLEDSLKRLCTDYVDILYFHRALPGVTLEEGLRAIGDLIHQGKIRYYGVSNFHGWRVAEVVRLADQLGIQRPTVSQPLYNIVDRSAEVEQLPSARHYGLGVVPYSPLARGVLTGKYASLDKLPEDSRAGRGDIRIQQTELRPESLVIAQRIAEHARERGISLIGFALAWVLKNRIVNAAIAGPRTEAHWDSYIDALDVNLSAEDEAFINDLVHPGHTSTPGYTDPAYPVEGRVVA